MTLSNRPTALALLLLLAACGATPEPMRRDLEPVQLGAIERVHAQADFYLSSQPSAEDLALLAESGIRTVVDQRRDEETPELDERAVVTGLGLEYHNPAFGGPLPLTDELLDETRALLRDAPKPLLMHCASANRTGAVWLAYRALDDDLPVEAALAEAKRVGLRSPQYEEFVLDYVARRRGE